MTRRLLLAVAALLASCSTPPSSSVTSASSSVVDAATANAGRVYVANQLAGSVTVIDAASDTVLATVPTGYDTNSLAVSPSGGRLYVSVPSSLDAVLTVDSATLATTSTVAAPDWVNGVAFSPDGKRAYVSAFHGNRLQVLDAATEETIGFAETGDTPVGVAVSPDGARIYVADQGADSLTVIDAATLTTLATVAVGHWPRGVVASRDGKRVYVSNTDVGQGGKTVSLIDAHTLAVIATVPTGGTAPNGLALTADGRWLYAANIMSNDVSVIDTAAKKVVARIPVASYPFELVLDASERKLFVTSHDTNAVSVVSTRTRKLVATILVGDGPLGIAYAAGTPPPSNLGVPPLGQALRDAGLLTATEASRMVRLGGELGFTVWAAPAVPSPGERVALVVVPEAGTAQPDASSAAARWTRDGWESFVDSSAHAFSTGGFAGLLFDFGAQPSPASIAAAVRLAVAGQTIWLNAGGGNYAVAVRAPDAVAWAGSVRADEDGLPRAPGAAIFAGHALAVSAESWPQSPAAHAILHWSTNGFGAIHHTPMSFAAIGVGPTGENARWSSALPASVLSAGATLAFWIEATSPSGGVIESRSGQNYGGPIAPAPAPGWGEVGDYTFTKCHAPPDCQYGWFYSSGLPDPLSATLADYQVYAWAPSPAVELWVPGVTDAPGVSATDAAGFVRVEVWSPFFSGKPDGAWAPHALAFDEVDGNNWRYRWQVRSQAANGLPAIGVDCPLDGDYPFKLRISTDGGASWSWLGTSGSPDGGANRTVHWQNADWICPPPTH